MSRLPRLSGKEVIKALSNAGFAVTGQARHGVVMRHDDGRRVVVPLHPELDRGMLHEIIKEARLTREEFQALL